MSSLYYILGLILGAATDPILVILIIVACFAIKSYSLRRQLLTHCIAAIAFASFSALVNKSVGSEQPSLRHVATTFLAYIVILSIVMLVKKFISMIGKNEADSVAIDPYWQKKERKNMAQLTNQQKSHNPIKLILIASTIAFIAAFFLAQKSSQDSDSFGEPPSTNWGFSLMAGALTIGGIVGVGYVLTKNRK